MTSVLDDICDAVVGVLNAATWSQDLTASKTRIPNIDDAESASGWKCLVAPRSREQTVGGRSRSGSRIQTYGVDIAIVFKATGGPAEREQAVEDLIELSDQIADYWIVRDFDVQGANVMVESTQQDPLYSVEDAREKGRAVGVVTLILKDAR